jgi:hypothetical protein
MSTLFIFSSRLFTKLKSLSNEIGPNQEFIWSDRSPSRGLAPASEVAGSEDIYHTILKLADHALFKMVRYALLQPLRPEWRSSVTSNIFSREKQLYLTSVKEQKLPKIAKIVYCKAISQYGSIQQCSVLFSIGTFLIWLTKPVKSDASFKAKFRQK